MNIQIFGVTKCFDTKKAERYFKERRVNYQFIDLNKKNISKGELQSIKTSVGLSALIDKNSKDYDKLNLKYIINDSVKEELLLNNPNLIKTPIVRNGKVSTIGYMPEIWETWE